MANQDQPTLNQRIGSASFYAISSIFIVMLNKNILTGLHFPSVQVVGLGQMTAAIFILFSCKKLNIVDFPDFEMGVVKKIFPLPLLYLGNLVFGLSSTKSLSLPMFTVLRRFSILLTLLLEIYILLKKPSRMIVFSVLLMIGGAMVAALNDLAFDMYGYIMILLNDLCTAANNVYMKKKLNAKELGKYGITFYNSLFMIIPTFLIALNSGQVEAAVEFEGWKNLSFVFQFLLSCVMGFVLMYSVILCNAYNSPLTTAVVGCLKNIFVTYVGMIFGGDYVFSYMNFIGINISVFGSVVYSMIVFREKNSSKAVVSKA